MVDVVDTFQDFTITLVQEGFAQITVDDPPASELAAGVLVQTHAFFINEGGQDDMFLRVRDIDLNTVIWELRSLIAAGGQMGGDCSLPDDTGRRVRMPNRVFNMRWEAGHVE